MVGSKIEIARKKGRRNVERGKSQEDGFKIVRQGKQRDGGRDGAMFRGREENYKERRDKE